MDAKHNFLIDEMKYRITFNLAGFALWFGIVYLLLRAAA